MKIQPSGSSKAKETKRNASIHVILAEVLAVTLLMSMLACGGGSGSQSTSNNPTLVSMQVTPASPSITVGKGQQFKATGTFSDNSMQDLTSTATWSSSSTAVATISNSGMATAVTAGTTTISALSGTVNGSTSLIATAAAPVNVQLSSLSENTANSFDSLTITGTGFNQGTSAISVLFVPENGDPMVMIPASASAAGSVQVMIPTFIGLTSGAFTAETVDVQVVQFSSSTTFLSNRMTGLQVNALASVPAGVPVGAMTAALLSSTLNISQAAQTAEGGSTSFASTAAALTQFNNDLAPLISAINTVTNDPTQTPALTTANGTTTPLTAQALGQADQLAQALIAAIVNQGSIPTNSASNCPAATGNTAYDSNLCSMQAYFQTLAGQVAASRHSKRAKSVNKLQITPPDKAVLTIYANIILGSVAEICEPAGGAVIYALVGAPIVTSLISSLAVNQETPPGADIAQGVGLNFLDHALFSGVPILGTAVDEIAALNTIITWSPPRKGILLSSGAAGFTGNDVTFLDPNTNAPVTFLKVPDQSQAAIIDSTTLVVSSPPTPFTLSLGTAGNGSGSISSFPSGTSFPAGTIVGLTAAPATGSTFTGWGGGGCSGTGTCSVTMSQNQAVTATFTQPVAQQIGVNGANVGYLGGSVSCTNTGGFFDNCSGSVTLDVEVAIENGEVAVQMDQLSFVGANPYSAGTTPGQAVFSLSGPVPQGACPAGVMNTDIEVIDGYANTIFVTIGQAMPPTSSVPLTVNCGPGT